MKRGHPKQRKARKPRAHVIRLNDAARFGKLMGKEWIGVSYDQATESGRVHVPNTGLVTFRESSNDPAVIVTVPEKSFKGSAREARRIVKALSKLYGSV
jgi:hypothetical protein